MAYKQQFRKVMEGELERSEKLRKYYDGWGLRCYLESAESFEGRLEEEDGIPFQPQLHIDTEQLKKMDCKFIISKIRIGNAHALHLTLRKTFTNIRNQPVFLYELA